MCKTCMGLLSCAVQPVMELLPLSQKLLQGWQTTAPNWSFGSSKSHSSSSPSMAAADSYLRAKLGSVLLVSPILEKSKIGIYNRSHSRGLITAQVCRLNTVIKVKHLLKCCADMSCCAPGVCGAGAVGDAPVLLSSPAPERGLVANSRQILSLFLYNSVHRYLRHIRTV